VGQFTPGIQLGIVVVLVGQFTPGIQLGVVVVLVGQFTPGIQEGVEVVLVGQFTPGIHLIEVVPVKQLIPGTHFGKVLLKVVVDVRTLVVLSLQLRSGLQPALQGFSQAPVLPLYCRPDGHLFLNFVPAVHL
jgi:hypothetical protein